VADLSKDVTEVDLKNLFKDVGYSLLPKVVNLNLNHISSVVPSEK